MIYLNKLIDLVDENKSPDIWVVKRGHWTDECV